MNVAEDGKNRIILFYWLNVKEKQHQPLNKAVQLGMQKVASNLYSRVPITRMPYNID